MRSIKLKYLLVLFILPAFVMAGELKGKYKKEKAIRKSYSVNNNAALDIDNKYGNVFVTTWDQNTTEIDVVIRVAGDDEKQVTARINSIDVAFSATKALVAATTKIGNVSCSGNISMEINYTVKIPKKGTIEVKNQYGGIQTGKIYGRTVLNCQYGDVNIDELNATNNLLKFQYCGSVRINFMKGANATVQYSQFRLGKASALQIKGQYSGIEIADVDDLNYSADYGHINARNAGKVTGKSTYSSIKFGRISQLLNLTTEYGDIKIDMFDPSTRNIAINSAYTGISLGFADDYPFDFEIQADYADVSGTNGFKYSLKNEKDNSRLYKGYYKSTGINKLFIKSDYGHIKLNRR